MAKTSKIVSLLRKKRRRENARKKGIKVKHAIRSRNYCALCGRVRGYMRRFDMCRICFRKNAEEGRIVGIKRSSW